MTQPDGLMPGGAFNYSSLAVLAQKTQEQWMDELEGNALGGLSLFRDSLFAALPEDLREGIEYTRAVLMAIVRRILGLPGQVWDSVEDALNALGASGIVDTINKVKAALDGIDLNGDPGAVLRAILEAGVDVFGVISSLLPLPIGWLTDSTPNMVWEGGFDGPETIVEGSGFVHDDSDGVPGSSPLGCARCDCDGADHQLSSPLIPVGPAWTLKPGTRVRWESITTTGDHPIRLDLQPMHVVGDVATPVGSLLMVASVESPSGSSGGTGGWGSEPIEGSWTVPDDGTVTHVVIRPHITEDATGGAVKFDNVFLQATQKMPQRFTDMLPEDLLSLLNWTRTVVESLMGAVGLTPSGVLLDDIFDLSDEMEWIREHASDAWEGLQELASDLLTNPAAVLGNIGQNMVTGLETVFNQLEEIYQGSVVTPVNSFVQSVKDWFNTWFGGGSGNAIPMSMRGTANGVAPLNSSAKVPTGNLPINEANGIAGLNGSTKIVTSLLVTDTANNVPTLDGSGKLKTGQLPSMDYVPTSAKGAANGVAPLNSNAVVPLAYLPEEAGGTGGSGDGRPYVILVKDSNETISNNTMSLLSGWTQIGTTSVTFEDGTNSRWKFGLEGLWDIRFVVVWGLTTGGLRAAGLFRRFSITGVSLGDRPVIQGSINSDEDLSVAGGVGSYGGQSISASVVERVSDYVSPGGNPWGFGGGQRAADDYFSIQVRHTRGSNTPVLGKMLLVDAIPLTYVSCTYLGAS